MLRRSFVRLSALCAALLPLVLSVAAAGDLQVTAPIVHANLAIYLVRGPAAAGTAPKSLEEALASGRVKVEETGSVNELTVENVGADKSSFKPATS